MVLCLKIIYQKNLVNRRPVHGLIVSTVIFLAASSFTSFGQAPGTKRWDFTTGGPIYSSPAIAEDGTAYVGSDDKKLYAITPAGSKRWEFPTGGLVRADPAVGPDGTIYIGSDDGNLYALNTDGKKLWTFATGKPIRSRVAIGTDGTVYLVSQNASLYALNPNGSKRWQFATGGSVRSPSIGMDGTIYVGHFSGNLYALNPNGSEKWKFFLGENYIPATEAVLDVDGAVSFLSDSSGIIPGYYTQTLYTLRPDGTKQSSTTKILSAFVIGENGVRYGGNGSELVAITPSGTVKWQTNFKPNSYGYHVTTIPAIAGDGTVYVGTDLKILFAVNSDGTEKWRFVTGGTPSTAPAIGTNGTVYIGADDGKLYAVNGSAGLAATAWPMYGRDAKHTGTVPNAVLSQTDLSLAMYPGLLIKGNVGSSYRIEFVNNVSDTNNWQLLATVTLDRTPFFFVDVNAGNATKRFYRAVALP